MAIEDGSPLMLPDDYADGIDNGYVDLPFESGSDDPQPIQYENLPGVSYDPKQDWREAQQQTVSRLYGEFAPGQEATDG